MRVFIQVRSSINTILLRRYIFENNDISTKSFVSLNRYYEYYILISDTKFYIKKTMKQL